MGCREVVTWGQVLGSGATLFRQKKLLLRVFHGMARRLRFIPEGGALVEVIRSSSC